MDAVKILADNRKARFNYTIDENLECGIVLQGTEVKSMKAGQFSFADAYAKIQEGELWLTGFHITPYDHGNLFNHTAERERKLLVHRQEIKKLSRKVDEKGFTLVPLKVYLKKGRVKIELGLCKGKKMYDKRENIKDRDLRRETERNFRIHL
ncbi:MAG: SsrA-binding protein SmpB [Spirochaetales bacterium]|jgi:SsrA-binding protein|nr:SsrA-binding protein SmpB [Spirochaetales bacterium]